MSIFLKFPPIFGGDYSDASTWVVLGLIVALVVGVGIVVTRLLNAEEVE